MKAGATTRHVNAALVLAGTISGKVTAAASGRPLAGICVTVISYSTIGVVGLTLGTAANGTYQVPGLAPGGYTVEFSVDAGFGGCGNTGNYAPFIHPGTVKVISGGTAKHIDGAMQAGGAIGGTVTAKSGGAVLAGICVFAFDLTTGSPAGQVITGPHGTYTLDGLATSRYGVQFSTGCGNNGNSRAAHLPTPGRGHRRRHHQQDQRRLVTRRDHHRDGDRGRRRRPPGRDLRGGLSPWRQPRLRGGHRTQRHLYPSRGWRPGADTVLFQAGCGNTANYATTFYPSPVRVKAGATTRHIDAALAVGGSIRGTITAAATGARLAGICVTAVDTQGNAVGGAATASNGTYAMGELGAGNYTVEFSDGCGNPRSYAPAVYPKAVHVTAGATTRHIDADLGRGGAITGTVTAAAGIRTTRDLCLRRRPRHR